MARANGTRIGIKAGTIDVTTTLPGTSVVQAVGPTLAASSSFDMSGGNTVALLFTCEGFNSGDVISATFAGQPMALGDGQIHAFLGAGGYDAYATGGRGGDVCHVTTLASSGPGSFTDAIATVPAAGRTTDV